MISESGTCLRLHPSCPPVTVAPTILQAGGAQHGIDTAVKVFSEGLKLLLISVRARTRRMDKNASEAAKDLVDGVSAVSKYKPFKMSTGTVSDYHEGLASRISMSSECQEAECTISLILYYVE